MRDCSCAAVSQTLWLMRVRVSGTFWPQRPAAVPPSTTVTAATRTTRWTRFSSARLAGVSPRLSLVFSHHVCGTFPYSAHWVFLIVDRTSVCGYGKVPCGFYVEVKSTASPPDQFLHQSICPTLVLWLKTGGLAGFALDSNMIAICSNTSVYVGVTIFPLVRSCPVPEQYKVRRSHQQEIVRRMSCCQAARIYSKGLPEGNIITVATNVSVARSCCS